MGSNMFALPAYWPKRFALLLLAMAFMAAGINHYLQPQLYVSIMPPYLPVHLELVYLSGFFEVLGGVGILFVRLRKIAAIGLLLLVVAVFPANLHMALNPQDFAHVAPAWVWYARLPIQLIILVWIYWCGLYSQVKLGTH